MLLPPHVSHLDTLPQDPQVLVFRHRLSPPGNGRNLARYNELLGGLWAFHDPVLSVAFRQSASNPEESRCCASDSQGSALLPRRTEPA